jgi:nicotinamide mononucleotide transporter
VNVLEWVAVAFGVAGVWLTVRQNPWCWPFGIVNVSLFALLFWRARLPANAGLQLVYVGLCLYGWWAWVRGGPEPGRLRVSRVPLRAALALLAVAPVLGLGLVALLPRATNAALPYWDAGTTAASLLAQWMQTRKWLENWVVWIAVDVVYVCMFLVQDLAPTAGLYAVFTLLAILGFREWSRAIRAGQGRGPGEPAA